MITWKEKKQQKLEQKIKNLLGSLGTTSDEVAETLERNGIRGLRAKSRSCPVGLYLQANLKNEVLAVGRSMVYVNDGASVETPSAVKTFITLFDTGNYPKLIRNYPKN